MEKQVVSSFGLKQTVNLLYISD